MSKRKGICRNCKKQPRVLDQYYVTKQWICAKCYKELQAAAHRSCLILELEKYGFLLNADVSNSEMETLLSKCGDLSRYIKDVFECLTGERPYKLGIDNDELDLLIRPIAIQTDRFERIAALQSQRSDDAYAQMAQFSERKRNDPHAYLYLPEHKVPLGPDSDFREVERMLRLQYHDAIPSSPPIKRSFNKTFLAPIPPGMYLSLEEVVIAGISHRWANASMFCEGNAQRLSLHRDPGNPHDATQFKLSVNSRIME